jgi:hypothetical protein
MQALEKEVLQVIQMMYMASHKDHRYPYLNTIYNILLGNEQSINASHFKHTPHFGSYKHLRKGTLQQTLESLEPQYLTSIQTPKKIKYELTEDAHTYLDRKKIELSSFKDNPQLKKLLPNISLGATYDDAYFEKMFVKQKEVGLIKNNTYGHVYLKEIEKEVAYESIEEKLFLNYLDANNIVKNIKAQSLCIEYGTKKRPRKYYPDFVLHTHDDKIIIVEVKALNNMSFIQNVNKYHVLKAYCEEHGYGYGMVGFNQRFYTYEWLKTRDIDKKLESYVLNTLKKEGYLSHDTFMLFKNRYKVHPLDIHSIVLKHGLTKIKRFDSIEVRK